MPLMPLRRASTLILSKFLDMKSNAMNRVLGDLTSTQRTEGSASGAYAWLNTPAVSAVAVTTDTNRQLMDEI